MELIQGQVSVRVVTQGVGVSLGILSEDVVLIIRPHLETMGELLATLEYQAEFPGTRKHHREER